MRNQSVSDFVAAAMDAALKSEEHKSLFGLHKSAQDLNDAKDKCGKCHEDKDSCSCDSSMADDNDARKAKKEDTKDSSKDSSSADDNDARKAKKEEDTKDSSAADDEEKVSSAFDVAIDSLLTASAALDHVGLGRGSALSLKLASLVVEAKKKDKDSKKSKKDSKDSKKTDSHSAKDKKHDSKKSDSKDSKKSDSHSAKDKKHDSKDSKKSDSKDSKKSSKK